MSRSPNDLKKRILKQDEILNNTLKLNAALSEQISIDKTSIVEVIIPDKLNTYDVFLWAKNDNHSIMNQHTDDDGNLRILVKP